MRLPRFKVAATFALGAAFSLVSPQANQVLHAQQSKDVAVVSIGPLDRVLKDTAYLLRASGQPEVGGFVSIMANQYTQGMDRTKPLGATISMDGEIPNATVFVPMTDINAFFDALAAIGIEPDNLGDGLYEIDTGGQVIYAKDSGDWMFIAQSEEALGDTPADPSAALGALPTNYNFAFRLNAKNVPTEMKEQAMEQIRLGFERSMAQQGGQTEEERAAAEEMGKASMDQLEQLVSDLEQLILGWAVEPDSQKTYFDAGAQFIEGSQLAQQADAAQGVTSAYTEFMLPEASAKFRFTSMIAESDRPLAKSNFRNSMSQVETQLEQADMPEQARELVSELLSGLSKIMEDTIDEGKFDGAGSVSVADETLRLLVGGYISDGNALAAEFKKAAAKLPEAPSVPKFEFDYETYKGVTLHRITSDAKIADPAAQKVFGDKITITVGTSDKGYLLALDPTGDALAKQAIDKLSGGSQKEVTPFEGVVKLEGILRYAQTVAPNPILDIMITKLSQFSGYDKVEVSSRPIRRGGVYRLSIDEGVLQAAGAAATAGNGGGGGF